jgi:hypothetical protein
VFLDSDDVWFPWTLATWRQAIETHGGASVVMGAHEPFQRSEELARVRYEPLRARAFADYLASAQASFVRTACVIAVKTEAVRRVGGFTTRRMTSEDHDLLYRLSVDPGFVWMEAPRVVGYRQHEGSSSRDLQRGYEGQCHLLEQERLGRYPGGDARRRERLLLLLHGTRHVTRWLTEQGRPGLALDLYQRSLRGHLTVPRWRYLLGFPPWLAMATLRRSRRLSRTS